MTQEATEPVNMPEPTMKRVEGAQQALPAELSAAERDRPLVKPIPIDDRKVEVIVRPLAKELEPAELARRLTNMVDIISKNGCSGKAISIAQGIAAPTMGGRWQNVMEAFPQLTITRDDGTKAFSAELDIDHLKMSDGKPMLDGKALTAMTLAAGKWLAKHKEAKPADVMIDDTFINDYKLGFALLESETRATCNSSALGLKSASSIPAKRTNTPKSNSP